MGTLVDLTIPTDQFALADTFTAVPEASFGTVRVAAHGPEGVMPFLRASAADLDALDDAIRRDETTEEITCLSTADDRALYRIDWDERIKRLIGNFVHMDGSLLGAYGQPDHWELRVLFPDRQSVSETYNNWREHGISPSIQRVNGVSNIVDYDGIELSPCQHETLVQAFKTDYYDVPRGITLDNLAEELGISHQALSERLRRGHRNLIASTLCESPAQERPPEV